MRIRITGENGDIEIKVIKERKVWRRFLGVLKVILAGKRQGKKLTAIFNYRMNADVPKTTLTRELGWGNWQWK